MAVIPSFQSGAKQPDLAGAYLGGRRTSIAEEQMRGELALGGARIAQAAAETQNRIALGQQELQARRIQNEMELMAQRETQEREHLRRQQEAEILRSYRETQIGMEERRLKIAEAANSQSIAEASRAFDQQQFYAKRFTQFKAQYLAEGNTEQQAAQRAAEQTALEMGPGTTGFSSALSPAREPAPKMDEVEKLKLTSTLDNIDREMAEQRKIVAESSKSSKYKESKEDKYERERIRNGALRTLRSLEAKRNALFQSVPGQGRMVPPESSPYGNPKNTTPIPMSAPHAWQDPIQPRVFMGTPIVEDATGFPISTPAWQGPNIIPDPAWQGPLPQEFTMHGRGGQTVSGLDFSNSSTISTPPTVTTKAQFDALKSGAVYIGKNGKRFQKP